MNNDESSVCIVWSRYWCEKSAKKDHKKYGRCLVCSEKLEDGVFVKDYSEEEKFLVCNKCNKLSEKTLNLCFENSLKKRNQTYAGCDWSTLT